MRGIIANETIIRVSVALIFLLFFFVDPRVSQADEIVVLDDMGRRVVLAGPARRIISLAPHLTENLFSVGAGKDIVGAVNHSDYPAQANSIQRVGGYKQFNLEVVASLQPDLILAWASGNGLDKIQQLIDLGFTVYISEPRTLDSIAESLDNLSALTGNADIEDSAGRHFRDILSILREDNKAKEVVSVFYQVWNTPLQTLSDGHVIGDVIKLCGGRNIFGSSSVIAPKVGVESVLKENPQAIIASGMGESRPEWLSEWLQWPQLQAVVHADLYFIPPDYLQRHTVRLLKGVEQMCSHLNSVRRKEIARTES